jgi:hypothetical protein
MNNELKMMQKEDLVTVIAAVSRIVPGGREGDHVNLQSVSQTGFEPNTSSKTAQKHYGFT